METIDLAQSLMVGNHVEKKVMGEVIPSTGYGSPETYRVPYRGRPAEGAVLALGLCLLVAKGGGAKSQDLEKDVCAFR